MTAPRRRHIDGALDGKVFAGAVRGDIEGLVNRKDLDGKLRRGIQRGEGHKTCAAWQGRARMAIGRARDRHIRPLRLEVAHAPIRW